MAISFNKREQEKKKQSKRLEKQKRKDERKAESGNDKSFDDMIAYVDENGVITDTPPEAGSKQQIDIEDIAVSTPKKEEVEDPILKGRVEYFNSDKGYGFIKNIESTDKYFFHVSGAPSSIGEGDIVTFDLERGQRGMNAVNIAFAD